MESMVRGGQYGHQFNDCNIKRLNEALIQKIDRKVKIKRRKPAWLGFNDELDLESRINTRGLCLSIGWDIALPILLVSFFSNFLERFSAYRDDIRYSLNLLLFGVIIGVYNVAKDIRREINRCKQLPKDK